MISGRASSNVHLLAMAFFVGGQLVFGIAVVPVLRGDPGRERMRAIGRRFGYGSLTALGLLIGAGRKCTRCKPRSCWRPS